MADNQREELENEIAKLNDADLDKVAGGGGCMPGYIRRLNSCWDCTRLAATFGVNDSVYIRNCT